MKLNLANKITLSRILAVPFLVLLLHFPSRVTCLVAMLCFIAVALTDLLDGFVARRGSMVTNFGKLLDPLADKVLICSVLVMLVQLQDEQGGSWVSAWVAIIIIARELIVTGLRAMAVDQDVVIAADKFGKLKTILQIVALCPLVLHYPWFGFDPRLPGQIMLYMALVMTVLSGMNYVYRFHKNWRYEEQAKEDV